MCVEYACSSLPWFVTFTDIKVTVGDLDQLDIETKLTFTTLAVLTGPVLTRPIVVTDEMKEILKFILAQEKKVTICIVGPPGTGKTTTLFWLYQQLKRNTCYHTRALPVKGSSSLSISFPEGKRLILLTDLYDPSTISTDDIQAFIELMLRHSGLISIFSLSSLFQVYRKLNAKKCSAWTKLFTTSICFKTKPFTPAETEQYLMGLDLNAMVERKDSARNIPKLLSFVLEDDYEDSIVIERDNETNALMEELDARGTRVNWEAELKLIMAVTEDLPISAFGLSRMTAESLYLCMSFLVYIGHDDRPESIFHMDPNFSSQFVSNMWAMGCKYVQSDSNTVIGLHFESCISKCILPDLHVTIKKLHASEDIIAATFTFTPLSVRAESIEMVYAERSKNVLWQMPQYNKSFDYAGYAHLNELGLCLVVIQVSIQKEGTKTKIAKSMHVADVLTKDVEGVVLIYINPLHTNFEELFCYAKEATSGAGVREKFNKWYYGQPSDYSKIFGLKAHLNNIFMPRT